MMLLENISYEHAFWYQRLSGSGTGQVIETIMLIYVLQNSDGEHTLDHKNTARNIITSKYEEWSETLH